jgi:hypothetical protein
MADRGTFRVAVLPPKGLFNAAWQDRIKKAFKPTNSFTPTSFNHPIEHMCSGDEREAFAMYAGQFSAAGQTIITTAPYVFDFETTPSLWHYEMFNLSWLKHFAASNRSLHSHFAMRLLQRWSRAQRPKQDLLAKTKIMHALASHGAKIACSLDADMQSEFLAIVAKEMARLVKSTPTTAYHTTIKAITVLTAATAFSGLDHVVKPAIEDLEGSINTLILPDGGAKDLSINALIDVLAILLVLKHAMKNNRHSFPPKTFQAIERMLSLLAMLRHGDGALAFCATENITVQKLEAFLTREDRAISPLQVAPYSKLARLAKGKTVLIAKTDASFDLEISDHAQLIFKSNSIGFEPVETMADVQNLAEGDIMQQGGRTCFLSSTGQDLRFEDRHSNPIEIVLNLALNVKVTALRESPDLLLLLPDRGIWKLSMRGAEARIEQNGRILRLLSTGQTRINWALKKQSKPTRTSTRKSDRELDLLV